MWIKLGLIDTRLIVIYYLWRKMMRAIVICGYNVILHVFHTFDFVQQY